MRTARDFGTEEPENEATPAMEGNGTRTIEQEPGHAPQQSHDAVANRYRTILHARHIVAVAANVR